MFRCDNFMNNLNSTLILNQKKIFKFWVPLAATWLMMSVEGPYLSALIARLAEPEYNLAAYGIAFSLALIFEAPVIMMMSASTSLVRDYHSFKQLRRFNYSLIFLLTVIIFLFTLPPIFYFVAENLIGLPQNVAELTHTAVVILIPWPAAIGFRRFYQGILIRRGLTRLVAYGTAIRLITMSITALVLYKFVNVAGVIVGASALSTAVIIEAIASKFMVKKTLLRIKNDLQEIENKLKQKHIIKFYYPLALTSLLTLGIQPFVTFFIGQSRMAIESFAVMPVITSLVFIFRALGLSYQEVVIALAGENFENFPQLKKFAINLGLFAAGFLMLIAFTPLSKIWFSNVSGLNNTLTDFALIPLMIMSFFPALTVLISFQRAVLVMSKETKQITYGTAIEFIGIIIIVAVCIKYLSFVGAISATIAFVFGRLAACGYLFPQTISSIRKLS
jgi:Na+-driven multidrug efflux pump